jgi:hypothetical protein
MKALLFAFFATVLPAGAEAQVHKCRQPNGAYVYSDLPCPRDTQKSETPNLTNANPQGRAPMSMDTGPLSPIDFGDTTHSRFRKARAIIESLRIDARECEWDMKVTKRHLPCMKFLQQMIEGREWSQAVGALGPVMLDEAFVAQNAIEVQSMVRDMEDVVRIKELAVLRAR